MAQKLVKQEGQKANCPGCQTPLICVPGYEGRLQWKNQSDQELAHYGYDPTKEGNARFSCAHKDDGTPKQEGSAQAPAPAPAQKTESQQVLDSAKEQPLPADDPDYTFFAKCHELEIKARNFMQKMGETNPSGEKIGMWVKMRLESRK